MTGSKVAAGLVGARILALLTLMGGAWLLGSASVDVPAVAVGSADQDWILIWSDRDSPVSVTWTSRPDGTVSLSRVPFKAADDTLPGDEGSVVVELHGRSRISVTKADPGVAVESGPSETDPQVVRIPALAGEPILQVIGRPRQAWSDEGAGRREVRSPWLTLGAAATATDGRVPPDETSRLSVGIVGATDENLDDYSPQSAPNESVTVSDYTLLEHGPRVYWSTIDGPNSDGFSRGVFPAVVRFETPRDVAAAQRDLLLSGVLLGLAPGLLIPEIQAALRRWRRSSS